MAHRPALYQFGDTGTVVPGVGSPCTGAAAWLDISGNPVGASLCFTNARKFQAGPMFFRAPFKFWMARMTASLAGWVSS